MTTPHSIAKELIDPTTIWFGSVVPLKQARILARAYLKLEKRLKRRTRARSSTATRT